MTRIVRFTLKCKPWAPACAVWNMENGVETFAVYQQIAFGSSIFQRLNWSDA